jgi:predicted secreted protein
MKIGSIIAIYFLFLAFSTFALLPFGVRTSDEMGEPSIPGQAESAPHRFDLKRHLARSALVALGLFGLYYANWHFGWITTDQLDFHN